MKYSIIIIFLASLFLVSCTERIDINVNSSNPVLVVQGNITNDAGPYVVQLSKTIDFDKANTFPAVSNAFVVISDNAGNKDTLTETPSGSGIYLTNSIQGVVGRTYTLTIKSEGKDYTAMASIPTPVQLDSVVVVVNPPGAPAPGGPPSKDTTRTLFQIFQDPAVIKNYYQIAKNVNGVIDRTPSLFEDSNVDGNEILIPYFGGNDVQIVRGDSVTMELRSLDKVTYDYYNTLSNIAGGGGGQAAAPENPTSNVSNGAMGYFAGYSTSRKTIVVDK